MSEGVSRKLTTMQGILMVLGTSIGGGMLGLPVVTSASGFFPSSCMLFVSWFFMTMTGLILAEFACKKKKDANLLSIYSEVLPFYGAFFSTIIYLFFFYALIVAYIVALARMLFDYQLFTSCSKSIELYIAFVAGAGALFLMISTSWISRVNGFLVFLMAVSYCVFSFLGSQYIDINRLREMNWIESYAALPLIFTSFGFQGSVPSLASLMEYDRKPIYISIILGTVITFLVYLLWQGIIIGAIPLHGEQGLLHSRSLGLDAISALVAHLPQHMSLMLMLFGKLFAFSAVATSLIGVSFGMRDFMRDLLKMSMMTIRSKFFLSCLIFLPALFFGFFFPNGFLLALSLAGGIGCAFLLGVMPVVTGYLGSIESIHIQLPRWLVRLRSAITNPFLLLLALLFFLGEMVGELVFLLFG